MPRWTKEEFIKHANKKHDNKVDLENCVKG